MLPLPISEKIDCPNHGGDACTLQILLPKTHGRTTPRPTKLEQIPRVLKSPGTGRTSAYRLFFKRFMHWQNTRTGQPIRSVFREKKYTSTSKFWSKFPVCH